MNAWRFKMMILLAIGLVALIAYWAWDHRGYWFIENFREVEPGRIYAGGYQYPRPLRQVVKRYKIKTVLSLRDGTDACEKRERAVLESSEVQFHKIVIPYKVPDVDRIAAIERAINFITDKANQPVYVHCWAGCHRTGAVVAIYRVSRCGWSEQAAREELVSWGGAALGTKWPKRLLHTYTVRAGQTIAHHSELGQLR